MMHYVYAIASEIDNRIYVGMSENMANRLKEHNSGKTKSTKAYRPWKMFYFEKLKTRSEARQREKYFKSGIGKERLKEKLANLR